eukprot:GHVU01107850.1.p1 GENE.GHVU01107850.1~~GHVU01107850.1.p1  ORF type:complete len:148 (-),score=15.51 GHVU01107850.1:728-1171(-)
MSRREAAERTVEQHRRSTLHIAATPPPCLRPEIARVRPTTTCARHADAHRQQQQHSFVSTQAETWTCWSLPGEWEALMPRSPPYMFRLFLRRRTVGWTHACVYSPPADGPGTPPPSPPTLLLCFLRLLKFSSFAFRFLLRFIDSFSS